MDKLIKDMMVFDFQNTILANVEAGKDNTNIAKEMIAFGVKFGLCGNLWHNYIAYLIACNENPFSLAYEKNSKNDDSIAEIALLDIANIEELYNLDINLIFPSNVALVTTMENFVVEKQVRYGKKVAKYIGELVSNLDKARTTIEFFNAIKSFYIQYGVGDFAFFGAYRLTKDGSGLVSISNADTRHLSELVGYELQKKQVVDNTLSFLAGKKTNNVLLYGDGGTGKSSTIKALLGEYYEDGLRIIEVYKHEFASISAIISKIKNRNYKFMLYLDDLSFEEFEIEYKYFKAIIEGGMETKPNNVVIYATSNRRHLIRETWSDKDDRKLDGDIHRNDTVQEKLSLVSRFGLSVFYGAPTKQEFLEIVHHLAMINNIEMEEPQLDRLALQWDIRGGGKSGRSAEQFINSLIKA